MKLSIMSWCVVLGLLSIATCHTHRALADQIEPPVAAFVYSAVAPATVIVECGDSHGTGFVVDPDGWILTNYHVIEDADIDSRTCTRCVWVHFGRLDQDGYMQVIDERVRAFVFKWDKDKDLALLKVENGPNPSRLPTVPLAKELPKPGSPCVVIGHPARGMLWTVRSGLLSGAGFWPSDLVDITVRRLVTDEPHSEVSAGSPQRKVLVSSCGLNPGDSGSALVNRNAELIGVSFAIPSGETSGGIHLDKFSYHVHLEEVRAFLANRPASATICEPAAWPAGWSSRPIDIDGDGHVDALAFAESKSGPLVGLALDLDHDSHTKQSGLFSSGLSESQFDYEFVVHFSPLRRVFYDTDNNGQIDLIVNETEGVSQQAFRLTGDGWICASITGRLYDSKQFQDETLREAFDELLSNGHLVDHCLQLGQPNARFVTVPQWDGYSTVDGTIWTPWSILPPLWINRVV